MTEDYIFDQDKNFNNFVRTAPISLTAHDIAVRRLGSLINDLDYFGRVIKGSYNNKTIIWRMLVGYNQTLRQIYIWGILPLFGEVDALWQELQDANDMVTKKNANAIDKLEEIEIEMSQMLDEKKLLFNIEEETTETYA